MLEQLKKSRNMPFLKIGMRIEFLHDGRIGNIIGCGNGANLKVKFDSSGQIGHCHPKWEMRYFGDDGAVIAEYDENNNEVVNNYRNCRTCRWEPAEWESRRMFCVKPGAGEMRYQGLCRYPEKKNAELR